MHIKICGLTNLDDALAAAEAGADLLGFNFYPASPRYITPAACGRIVAALRGRGVDARAVGVFVNAPPDAVAAIAAECGLNLLQLHGDEPPADLAALGPWAFKAVRPADAAAAAAALDLYGGRAVAPTLLVDACAAGHYGGSGRPADWALAAQVARRAPLLLAGGLHPGNVAAAIAAVQPWGVDVASGVECAPGRKDAAKIRAFVAAARGEPGIQNGQVMACT